VSRAFVNEDAGDAAPRYSLPARDDPAFPAAAARALLRGADLGDSASAEDATGYRWGDPRLITEVERLLSEAIDRRDDRMETLAERFLRVARGRG